MLGSRAATALTDPPREDNAAVLSHHLTSWAHGSLVSPCLGNDPTKHALGPLCLTMQSAANRVNRPGASGVSGQVGDSVIWNQTPLSLS
jgi:hypothetical protein